LDSNEIIGAVAPEAEEPVEGQAWCLRCDRITGYLLRKVEFLGNPVRASFFCTVCGERIAPESQDRNGALRRRAEARWLRTGAALSFLCMLLLPFLLVLVLVALLWRWL